jgi:two-component system, OmpR family, alkaline phosphatase synthesis response regulator PhoP
MSVPTLMVEDDPNVASTLAERLRANGYDVTPAASVEAALAAIGTRPFQLALLDVGLPDGSGLDVARHLQRHSPGTAIVFLTAYGTPDDRIQGLELGADDYVTKPFVFRELLLRLNNAVKRARDLQQPTAGTSGVVRIGLAEVDFGRFTARVGNTTHPLTHKECAVLKLLAERPGIAVTRDEILDRAWSPDEFPTQRTVDNFIVRLRRLVEEDPAHPRTIRSIRGVGYLFEAHP